MEVLNGLWVGDAFECARRCLAAMDGQDEETRQALERAAGKYALRALGLDGQEATGVAPCPARAKGQDARV